MCVSVEHFSLTPCITMNISNINALSTFYCAYPKTDSDLEKNFKYVTLVFVRMVGILSNIFVILLVAKYTARRNIHHLIINMVVSDVLFLTSNLLLNPEISEKHFDIQSLYPSGVWGDILCKFTSFVEETSFKISLVTLLIISIERFRASRQTLLRSRPYTLKIRVAILGICWLVPIVWFAYFSYAISFDEVRKSCTPFLTIIYKNYFIYRSSEGYFLLFLTVLIVTLNIRTIRQLSSNQEIQGYLNYEQMIKRRRRTRSAVHMVLVSVLLYASCWLPHYILLCLICFDITMSSKFLPRCFDFNSLFYIIRGLLPSVNACFSPFVYIIFLADFQEAAKMVLCCCKKAIKQRQSREEIPLRHMNNT